MAPKRTIPAIDWQIDCQIACCCQLLATHHLQWKFQSNGWVGWQTRRKLILDFGKYCCCAIYPAHRWGCSQIRWAKNFLKLQTAHVNLNLVPNILFSQHKPISVLRHGLSFALRLSYSPANLVSIIHIGQPRLQYTLLASCN